MNVSKKAIYAIAVVAGLGSASSAMAATIDQISNPGTGGLKAQNEPTGSNLVQLRVGSLGISARCNLALTGTGTNAGAGISISGASITPGEFLCSFATPVNLPWSGQWDSPTQLTLAGVQVNTSLGTCGPATITVPYDNSTSEINLAGIPLGTCTFVQGKLKVRTNPGNVPVTISP